MSVVKRVQALTRKVVGARASKGALNRVTSPNREHAAWVLKRVRKYAKTNRKGIAKSAIGFRNVGGHNLNAKGHAKRSGLSTY